MKNKLILAICICILALTIGSASATVTNIDTGENFKSIQGATGDRDTKDGHTIVVGPGVYHENVIVRKSLTIKSANESYDNVTIIAENSGISVIHIFTNNASIIGFRVIGVEGLLTDGSITYSTGITFYTARDCYVANCSIEGTNTGVVFQNAVNNTIEHNDIKDSYRGGVFMFKSSYWNSANNSILNNSIYDNNGIGIDVLESENTTLLNNTIYNNSGDGIRLSCSDNNCSIMGNTVIQNKKHGIRVRDATGILIIQNNISYNHWHGIYLSGSMSICEIRDNIICWNGESGIQAVNSYKSVIEGNICENNGKE